MLRFPLTLVVDDECDTRFFNMPHGNSNVLYARNSLDGLGILARAWTEWYMKPEGDPDPTIEALYLDHDLGDNDTIMPVINFLEITAQAGGGGWIKLIIIHSMNPTVAKSIVPSLSKQFKVEHYPYHTLTSI